MSGENTIFVGNIPFNTQEGDLRSLFEQFGEVSKISIPQDRATGRPRGFAFVEFAADDAADDVVRRALSLDGQELNGRNMNVKIAEKKK